MTPSTARILDANFNRAREALRVMEEYPRFVQDNPGGCEALKRLRHDLAELVQRLPADALLAARDTPGDVGTGISAEAERRRKSPLDVFTAAAKRLPEALRALEEYGKTVDAEFAAAIEALRYRAYDIEQRIRLRGERAARFAKVRLYVIITEALCRRTWLETAEQALTGGAGCLQLREKTLDDRELLDRARKLIALCRERGALCIVNDRPDIAALADADGVHLGQTDLPVRDAHRVVGPDRLIGLSTHTPEQLRAAIAGQPDYIAVGPMFASTTKPQDHVPGPALLELALRETPIPIVPIGGITGDNARDLRARRAKCVCACSDVISAQDVCAAARALGGKEGS